MLVDKNDTQRYFHRMPFIHQHNLPDAELWTCLVDLNVTSRAELICLQEGNDASFTNWTEKERTSTYVKPLLCILQCDVDHHGHFQFNVIQYYIAARRLTSHTHCLHEWEYVTRIITVHTYVRLPKKNIKVRSQCATTAALLNAHTVLRFVLMSCRR